MKTRFNVRRFIRRAGIGLVGALALGGAYLGMLQLTGNFNTVVAGEFYRSGQLTSAQIVDYTKRYGIKTIINLRGDNAGSAWYDAEVAEARRLNVSHVNFGMSAKQELTAKRVATLVGLMESAEKPILVHCKAGADRSGLASALYLAAVNHSTEPTADAQLSIRYGHFSLPFIAEYAMDSTLKAYESSTRHSLSQSSSEKDEGTKTKSTSEEALKRLGCSSETRCGSEER